LDLYFSLPALLITSKIAEWFTTVRCLEHEELEESNPVWKKMLHSHKFFVLFLLLFGMGICIIILEFLIREFDKLLYLVLYCWEIFINVYATINNVYNLSWVSQLEQKNRRLK